MPIGGESVEEPTDLAAPNADLGEGTADVIIDHTLDGEAHRAVPEIVDLRDRGPVVAVRKRRMAHRVGGPHHRQRPPPGLAKPGDPGESPADTTRSCCGPHAPSLTCAALRELRHFPEPGGRVLRLR